MSERVNPADAFLLILMAALAAAWGIAGSMDVSQRTQPGFAMNDKHEIVEFIPGGNAEQINMQLGDQVIGIDGNRIEDIGTIVRLPRVPAGDHMSFTVTRGEQTIRYRPLFDYLDDRQQAREHLETIVGLIFLIVPLVVCLIRPNVATRVLALAGVGLSLFFFDGAYLASYDVRAVAMTVARLFALLGLAAVVHFMLIFPERRSLIDKSWGKKLVYLPVLLIWFADAGRLLFTPNAETSWHQWSLGFSQTGVLAYMVLGFILLVSNYLQATGARRQQLALTFMLVATLLACIPSVVVCVAGWFTADLKLPWQGFYFALLALIPMAWSYSAARSS